MTDHDGRVPRAVARFRRVGADDVRMGTTSSAGQQTTGYYLVNDPGQGFGIVWAKGPAGGTSKSVYLGNTLKQAQANWLHAAGHVGAIGMYEVDVDQMWHSLASHRVAWWHSTPGNAQPTMDLYTAALSAAGASSLAAILSAAGLADVLPGEEQVGTTAPNETTPADAKQVDEATNPEESSGPSPKELAPKVGTTFATTNLNSGILSFLTDPKTWLRFAEMIGGAVLVAMGLKSLMGSPTTNPVDLVPSSARNAAKLAAMG